MRDIQPHRFNNGFAWKPVPRLGGLATSEQCDAFDRDGFVLMEGVLDRQQVDEVRQEIDAFEERKRAWLKERGDVAYDISDADAITFTELIVGKSDTLKRFATQEVYGRLAADFVGPEVRIYWDQAVYKLPEPEREFPWHQDTGYTFTLPQHYLTCWTPLVDATVENGCPWVLPGLHTQGTLKHWWTDVGWRCVDDADPRTDGAVPVEAKAGDVICFSSLTPHRTGPNVTDGVRKAYILQFCAEGSTAFDPRPQNDETRQFPVTRRGVPVVTTT
jgi:ectoine hydroxylase-related dioxygenase (phytanoyl-CoA dioxygenase family)